MKVNFVITPSDFGREKITAVLHYEKNKRVNVACQDNKWWVERRYELRPVSREVFIGEFNASKINEFSTKGLLNTTEFTRQSFKTFRRKLKTL